MIVSRGKFADETCRQKWGACRRYCDEIAGYNPMSLGMSHVGEIARILTFFSYCIFRVCYKIDFSRYNLEFSDEKSF